MARRVGRSNAYISQVKSGRLDVAVISLVAMAIASQKPLKYFVPTYYKDRDEDLNGEGWELIQHFRKIKTKETRKIAINTMKQLSEIK